MFRFWTSSLKRTASTLSRSTYLVVSCFICFVYVLLIGFKSLIIVMHLAFKSVLCRFVKPLSQIGGWVCTHTNVKPRYIRNVPVPSQEPVIQWRTLMFKFYLLYITFEYYQFLFLGPVCISAWIYVSIIEGLGAKCRCL